MVKKGDFYLKNKRLYYYMTFFVGSTIKKKLQKLEIWSLSIYFKNVNKCIIKKKNGNEHAW